MREAVAESQVPLEVKIGVRSWKARRVPVGRRLARLAVIVRVCDTAEGGGGGGLVVVVVVGSVVDGSVGGGVGLDLRDMFRELGGGCGGANSGGGGGGRRQLDWGRAKRTFAYGREFLRNIW